MNIHHLPLYANIDCIEVSDVHQTFYNVNNLTDLFTNIIGDTIEFLFFIKKLIYMIKYKCIT